MVKNKSSNGTSNLKYNRHNASKPKFNIQKIKMKGRLFKKSPIKRALSNPKFVCHNTSKPKLNIEINLQKIKMKGRLLKKRPIQ